MADKPMIELELDKLEESIKEVEKGLDEAQDKAILALAKGAVKVAFDLLGEGMRRAPKDTGYLRGSGIALVNEKKVASIIPTGEGDGHRPKRNTQNFATLVNRVMNEVVGEVVFDAPYAAAQHEIEEFEHRDGEAKYLEKPLKERSRYYVEWLAETIRKDLDRG